MKTPILHVLEDATVVDSFINLMETVYPQESIYLVIIDGNNPIKVHSQERVLFFQRKSKELVDFLRNTSSYRHVCLHSIGDEKLLLNIHHPSVSWVIWGWDLYEKLLYFVGYQLYESERDQYRIRARGKNMPVFIYRVLTFMRDLKIFYREKRLLRRVKYIITDNDCDYGVYKQYFPRSKKEHLGTINYYPIEQLIKNSFIHKECNGTAIWVGNSASANGNHLGVFRLLSTFSNNIKVYSPISYGDKRFTDYIDQEGTRLLGECFCPLKEFVPVEQYYSLFLDANSFVFGHYRQCGVGNILMALFFGGKCFFYKKNPLYQMYLDSGFSVFSIEDDLNEKFAVTPLSSDVRNKNRELVLKIASYESSLEQIRNVFGKI